MFSFLLLALQVAAFWDWALCDYVKTQNNIPCSGASDIERTTCYVEDLIATANMAFNAPPLCVDLEVQIIPDISCSQSGSYYESIDVTNTGSSGFVVNFQAATGILGSLQDDQVRHMLAGSEVGTNIGYAFYSAVCRPNRTGASWVRGGKWHYFAHELGHQLGVEDHLKGKDAKGGDYIMEGFVQDGEFALKSQNAMKAHIESSVNLDGTCKP